MCSYLFVAMAYGMMMQEAGFAWYDSLLASLTIYTGAFQFVLIIFLSSGASVLTIAVTALLMNSRQAFYSLSFVDEFKKMGRKMPYMIHTMTDETYAVNCTLTEQGEERRGIMFFVALFSRCYWMIGAVAGGVPFDRGTVGIYAAGAYHRIRDPADPGEKGGGIDGAGKNHRDHITLRCDHIFLTRTAFFQEIRKANRMIREMQYTKQR